MEFFASAFWTGFLWPLIIMIAESVLVLVVLLVAIAYILLADRKIWAAVQIRRGPNVVVPWRLFQSFADLLKFVLKEPIIPAGANKGVFLLAPLVSCVLALAAWAAIPMKLGWVISATNVGVLYIFAISSLSIYGIIMAGWSSNSKYPFLAALRSAAQMVSYEVSIGFVIITVLLCAGSLNLGEIVDAQEEHGLATLLGIPWLSILNWYWLPLFPMFIVFFISALAETNRPPFDLVEAESELVAGFMVEYGSTPYLLFMLGEYVAITTMCAMATILFLGGWLSPIPFAPFPRVPGLIWFALKLFFMFFLFAMAKAIVPRYRYDQLMRLGWKVFLPASLAMVAIVAGVLQYGGFLAKWRSNGMMDLSLAGLIGAVIGTIVAALAYVPLLTFVERGLRSRVSAGSADGRGGFEQEASLLRKAVLAGDIILFAGIGYWLGAMMAD